MRRATQKLQMFKTVKLEWLLFQFRLIPKFLSLIWFATQATLWNYFLYLWPKDKNIFIRPKERRRTQSFFELVRDLGPASSQSNSKSFGLGTDCKKTVFLSCLTHGFAHSRVKKSTFNLKILDFVGDIGIIRNDFQSWFHSIIKLWVVFIWVWNLKIPGIQPRHANLAYVRRFEWFWWPRKFLAGTWSGYDAQIMTPNHRFTA